jgi:V/A-type H+-transporting ATPase subunit D
MERVAQTRLALLRARRRAERVVRGIELLRRKREALVVGLMRLAQPAIVGRRQLAERAAAAHGLLFPALEAHGADGLRALGWPARDLGARLEVSRTWGVEVMNVRETPAVRRSVAARGVSPAAAGAAVIEAAGAYETLAELLLATAGREAVLRGVGAALERTTRQLHTLEERVLPPLQAMIRRVTRTLDEREREDQQRLRRFRGRARAT